MMAPLYYGQGKVIAEVDCKAVGAEPRVAGYRLLFHLDFARMIWDGDVVPVLTALRVAVKLNGVAIGIAFPTGEDFVSLSHPQSRNATPIRLTFALDIDAPALEEIEQRRAGQGVTFELDALGTAAAYALSNDGASVNVDPFLAPAQSIKPLMFEPQLSKGDFFLSVSQSDWIKLLDRMGYGRSLLFEIPWPSGDDGVLRAALSHFERARKLFLSGHYTQSVAESRVSLDEAHTAIKFGQAPWSIVSNNRSRENMSRQQRFLLTWYSVRHLTHLAHHGESYSRNEAHYILGMAALALSLAAHSPGELQRARELPESDHA